MRKITLICILYLFIAIPIIAQEIVTSKTSDWNTLRRSGFYESQNITSAPARADWFWGINIAHSSNSTVSNIPYHYGAQILFSIAPPTNAPKMYIRSINKDGEGLWAEVLHSKGNHAIDGKLIAKEIEIKVNTGADFVFNPDYQLKPLSEIEGFVKENRHLPEIPSEKEMQENGLNVNDMQIKLLQKIEELTLYVIQQQKELESVKSENKKQSERIEEQQKVIDKLQNK